MEEKVDKIFKFEADDIKNHIRYEMKLYEKMGESFNYIHNMLVKLKYHKKYKAADVFKLEKLKYDEGKNYNWVAITCGTAKLILRVYGGHFTIFCNNETIRQLKGGSSYIRNRYSAFTFFVNRDKVPVDKRDYYHEHTFEDLNKIMPAIIKGIAEDKVFTFWNSYSLVRPDYCEVKNVFFGEDSASIDKVIFCAEELSSEHLSLFAQNDMLEILKGIKDAVGKPFGRDKVKSITTEFPKQYSDPYYHGVGITVVKENGKEDFHDVYRLCQWYMEDVEKLMEL